MKTKIMVLLTMLILGGGLVIVGRERTTSRNRYEESKKAPAISGRFVKLEVHQKFADRVNVLLDMQIELLKKSIEFETRIEHLEYNAIPTVFLSAKYKGELDKMRAISAEGIIKRVTKRVRDNVVESEKETE